MDQQRRWQTGRGRDGGRDSSERSRLAPRLSAIGALGFLGLSLGVVGSFMLFFAVGGPRVLHTAPSPTTSTRPPVLTAVAVTPVAVTPSAAAVAPARQPTPEGVGVSPGAATVPLASTAPPARQDSESGGAVRPEEERVEQALGTLAADEDRVGQLLMLGWLGDGAEDARRTVRELRPGGIMHLGNTSVAAEAGAINRALPPIAREYGVLPPLIAIDHEGGLVQRIADVPNLGASAQFAARRPSDLEACERGATHARQLRPLGFSMSFAPVLDVNNNPSNPVIGSRSFGGDPELVARLGGAYARGLQGGGIAAVGKHFPGHGNTGVDSHLQLPILEHTEAELERIELIPFRRAIASPTNIAGIMSAHIVFPSVDPSRAPATLSRPIMTGLLRDKLGFDGLVVTDDLGSMKAITDNYTPGQAAVRAIQAGVDMLIIGGDTARQREARDALLTALDNGQLPRERLEEAVRHVVRVKVRFGLLGGPPAAEVGCS